MKLQALLVALLILLSLKAKTSPIAKLKAVLKNDSTNKPVAYAQIYNGTARLGAISDSNGHFSLKANPGDTLAILALGYFHKKYIVGLMDTLLTTIYLTERSYDIEEVSIEMPTKYSEFRKAFLEVDLDAGKPMPELPKHNPYKTPVLLDTNILFKPSFYLKHPVTALYHKFSKVEKSKRKVLYLQQQELKQGSVDKKYNDELVSEITGLYGFELRSFMAWCNFSFNYLYETSSLEIVDAIYKKYDTYLKCCYEGEKSDSLHKGN